MKFIHTSDIHLASKLTTRLPSSKVAPRRRELTQGFVRMCSDAMNTGVSAILIAGDLFDSEKISHREIDQLIAIIERAENITFLYLPGNHERDVIAASGEELPKNLLIFGESWTYFRVGEVTFAGRSETAANMFSELQLPEYGKNVVVLHGELRDKSAQGGVLP